MKPITSREDLLRVLEATLLKYAESDDKFTDDDRITLADSLLLGLLDDQTRQLIQDLPGLFTFIDDNLDLINARHGQEAGEAFNRLLQDLDDTTEEQAQEVHKRILAATCAQSKESSASTTEVSPLPRTSMEGASLVEKCAGVGGSAIAPAEVRSLIRFVVEGVFPDALAFLEAMIDGIEMRMQPGVASLNLAVEASLGFSSTEEACDDLESVISSIILVSQACSASEVRSAMAQLVDSELERRHVSTSLRPRVQVCIDQFWHRKARPD